MEDVLFGIFLYFIFGILMLLISCIFLQEPEEHQGHVALGVIIFWPLLFVVTLFKAAKVFPFELFKIFKYTIKWVNS